MTATRRLAAILAADGVGYSRLIGGDEGSTLQAFKAIRAELLDPTIAAHNGRIVKTTGNGLLVEFSSVVDALRCATEVQTRNGRAKSARRGTAPFPPMRWPLAARTGSIRPCAPKPIASFRSAP